jgi:ATP-binding protein involved in chromosome partitioning
MVTKYLQMFIGGMDWGKLDYLILDLPPGTGDVQLSLAQSVPLSGAIIVTTPQDVSLNIARRGLRMFEKVKVPILGIVENMSGFDCPHCGKHTDIFRSGGGDRMSKELGVPFLGPVPLDADVVVSGDEGTPIVVSKPESPSAKAYFTLGTHLAGQLSGADATSVPPFSWSWETGAGAPAWKESATRKGGGAKVPVGYQKRDPRTLSVLWQDATRDDFDVRDLRLACQCALCIEEMSGRKILDPRSVRQDVAPRDITSVGLYAIAVTWNDGHSSSIYSFDLLRSLGDAARARGSQEV